MTSHLALWIRTIASLLHYSLFLRGVKDMLDSILQRQSHRIVVLLMLFLLHATAVHADADLVVTTDAPLTKPRETFGNLWKNNRHKCFCGRAMPSILRREA